MTNEEYVRLLGKFMQMKLDSRSNDDYVVNPQQMDKFLDAVSFFKEIMDDLGGEFEEVTAVPKAESGGITAIFNLFDTPFNKIERFRDIIGFSTDFTAFARTDGKVCISLSIPHVFVHKDKLNK